MTYSEIKITFNQDMPINGIARINYSIGTSTAQILETWKTSRSKSKEVTVGTPTGIVGERSAINFLQAFNLDYNSSNIFEVVRISNIVIIKSINPNLKFNDGQAFIESGHSTASISTFFSGPCSKTYIITIDGMPDEDVTYDLMFLPDVGRTELGKAVKLNSAGQKQIWIDVGSGPSAQATGTDSFELTLINTSATPKKVSGNIGFSNCEV
ncbi:hypothetical protein [Aquimarina macrocephali]|uniref:hypothetical protein n=1 Tax=Aquimarina macrocephali TaxID=666563 RepID=UPI003F667F7A